MVELEDTQDLGSCGQPCRFDPCYPHQKDAASIKRKLRFFPCLKRDMILMWIIYIEHGELPRKENAHKQKSGNKCPEEYICLAMI